MIVNADALQVYDNWRLLTARPSAEDEALAPHRLYGHVAPGAPYSVGHWLREVAPAAAGARGRSSSAAPGSISPRSPRGWPRSPRRRRRSAPRPTRGCAEGGPGALLAELDAETRRPDRPAEPAPRAARLGGAARHRPRPCRLAGPRPAPPLLPLAAAAAFVVEAPPERLDPAHRGAVRRHAGGRRAGRGAGESRRWDPALPSSQAIGAAELIAHLRGEITLPQARAGRDSLDPAICKAATHLVPGADAGVDKGAAERLEPERRPRGRPPRAEQAAKLPEDPRRPRRRRTRRRRRFSARRRRSAGTRRRSRRTDLLGRAPRRWSPARSPAEPGSRICRARGRAAPEACAEAAPRLRALPRCRKPSAPRPRLRPPSPAASPSRRRPAGADAEAASANVPRPRRAAGQPPRRSQPGFPRRRADPARPGRPLADRGDALVFGAAACCGSPAARAGSPSPASPAALARITASSCRRAPCMATRSPRRPMATRCSSRAAPRQACPRRRSICGSAMPTEQNELTQLIDAIQREIDRDLPARDRALEHQAGLLSVWLERHIAAHQRDEPAEPAARRLSAAYAALVEKQFRDGLSVADFAAELGVTPTHLTRACNAACGHSAHDILAGPDLLRGPPASARDRGAGAPRSAPRWASTRRPISPAPSRRPPARRPPASATAARSADPASAAPAPARARLFSAMPLLCGGHGFSMRAMSQTRREMAESDRDAATDLRAHSQPNDRPPGRGAPARPGPAARTERHRETMMTDSDPYRRARCTRASGSMPRNAAPASSAAASS